MQERTGADTPGTVGYGIVLVVALWASAGQHHNTSVSAVISIMAVLAIIIGAFRLRAALHQRHGSYRTKTVLLNLWLLWLGLMGTVLQIVSLLAPIAVDVFEGAVLGNAALATAVFLLPSLFMRER